MRSWYARFVGVGVLVLGVAAAGTAGAQVSAEKKGTEVVLSAKIDFKAPKAKVWKVLTSMDGLSALLDFERDAAVKAKALGRVGDTASGKQDHDPGTLVVTMVKPEEELRLAFDSVASTYLCGHRIQLQPSASGGTTLVFTERYTDSGNVDENAGYSVDDLKKQVAKFRVLVEK